MSDLLSKIRDDYPNAARVLQDAGLRTDSEIQSLTRDDLRDLFPGPRMFTQRRSLFEMIHKHKPLEELFKELKQFIPDETLREALTGSGVLVNYLNILRDMKDRVCGVENFLQAHINFLENSSKAPADLEPERGAEYNPMGKGAESAQMETNTGWSDMSVPSGGMTSPKKQPEVRTEPNQTNSFWSLFTGNLSKEGSQSNKRSFRDHPPITFPPKETLRYKMVVSGITFNAEKQLLQQIQQSITTHNLKETKNEEDCHIIIVFCPIVSRAGTDVQEATSNITGSKPVILVLMHHSYEAKATSFSGMNDFRNMFSVDVFYHETKQGLIDCPQNEQAVSQIKKRISVL
ncbi:uncharacterized protein ACNS7B_002929 isoform 2-T3 [Menidia menidia]